MSAYTRLGSGLWEWEPFINLEPGGQVLWLALYTSAEAKRNVPGLWHGSVASMAEASHRTADETRANLDRLLEAELVEFDIKLRVLRLTQLPDAGESPANANVLRGWFRRFTTVPACQVRDAHVATIRWMLDQYARDSGKPVSQSHEQAWQETFGRIVVPAPRRRGVRRLAENDTSTATQPSLFSRPNGLETVPQAPSQWAEGTSVDNSDSLHQMNNSAGPETVPDTVSKRYGSGSGLGSGSGSPDPEGGAGGGDPVDALLATISAALNGRPWRLANSTPERVLVADQLSRLVPVDFALLGRWMRATAFKERDAVDLLCTPGRVIWAVGAAERWEHEQQEHADRASEMSKALHADLAKVGLGTLVS